MRAELTALGTQVAFVHMQSPEDADRWFDRFGLGDVPRFSDPAHALYRAFLLEKGSFGTLAHPRVWLRWLRAASARGASPQGRHWRQLTGVFVLRGDQVLVEVRHTNSAARPDYLALVRAAAAGGYNT